MIYVISYRQIVLHYTTCLPGFVLKYFSHYVFRYKFHQNPNMMYLCGFLEPDSVLLLGMWVM